MDTLYQKESYSNYALCWSGGIGGDASAECVVPDSMPDVGAVVDCDAIISIRSKETETGRLRASTELSVHILYQSEDGSELCSLPLTMSCELSAAAPELDNACHSLLHLRLRGLETRVINSRKLSIHIQISGQASCYRRQELLFVQSVREPGAELEIKKQKDPVCLVSDVREKTFVITTEQSLPSTGESHEKILLQHVQLILDNCEFIGEKLVFRGRAQIFLLLAGSGEAQPCRFESEFSQVMELQGDNDPDPEISLLLTGAYFDLPEHESGKIGCELHILAQAAGRKSTEIEYIADLYSNQRNIQPVLQAEKICRSMQSIQQEQTAVHHAELPPDLRKLLYTRATVSAVSSDADGSFVSIAVKLLYLRSDNSYGSSVLRMKERIHLPTDGEKSLHWCTVLAGETLVSQSAGGIDLRLPLFIRACLTQNTEIAHVSGITEGAETLPDTASVTLLYASSKDELWCLAKKHRSTCDAIRKANNGREEGLLLIPRAR